MMKHKVYKCKPVVSQRQLYRRVGKAKSYYKAVNEHEKHYTHTLQLEVNSESDNANYLNTASTSSVTSKELSNPPVDISFDLSINSNLDSII